MANQTSFVERTPEEKKAWVEQQRALGNKSILSKRDWYKKNETRIRLENIEKTVKAEREENKKFRESITDSVKKLLK